MAESRPTTELCSVTEKDAIWNSINDELEIKLSSLSCDLLARKLSSSEAAVAFSNVVTPVLIEHGVIKEKSSCHHRPRRIE